MVVEEADATAWNQSIARALAENTFFGSCNFYTYCAIKPA